MGYLKQAIGERILRHIQSFLGTFRKSRSSVPFSWSTSVWKENKTLLRIILANRQRCVGDVVCNTCQLLSVPLFLTTVSLNS